MYFRVKNTLKNNYYHTPEYLKNYLIFLYQNKIQ